MNRSIIHEPDPKLDLVFERIVDVPRVPIWTAWTTPAQLKQWFTPAPWKTVDCNIDLRPGGLFRTVMRSPEGQELLNVGCYLEIVENEKLVWTNALAPGYRPCKAPEATSCVTFFFTAVVAL
ncbi:MAG: SRPBCC domain-containing protein, partial [Gammaproteobacteria bacterium]